MEMVNQRQPGPDQLKIYITGGSPLNCFCFELACHELQRLKPTMVASDTSLDIELSLKLQCQAFGRLFSQLAFGICCLHVCLLSYIHWYASGQLFELIRRGCACWLHTGHSLGGALATLAAYDIRKQLQASGKQDVEVMCYSFGAPRTGNHAFAADYNRVVPDTWSIINDQVSSIVWLMM